MSIKSQSSLVGNYTKRTSPGPDDLIIPHIYSGTNLHARAAYHLVAGSYDPDFFPVMTLFLLVDMPLSLAMDTLLLPVTVYRQVAKGDIILCQIPKCGIITGTYPVP